MFEEVRGASYILRMNECALDFRIAFVRKIVLGAAVLWSLAMGISAAMTELGLARR